MTLYYLNYNNYFNRILRYEATLDDYLPYVITTQTESNFIQADGISTTITLNYKPYEDPSLVPDYLVIYDETFGEINSRWYVIEAIKTAKLQYKVRLFRDLLVDYLEYIKTAPMYIEKGRPTINSPYIYNQESFESNQIKQEEILLKDKTGCAWAVGYLVKNATKDGAINGNINMMANAEGAIQLGTTLESWYFYKYITEIDGATTGNATLYAPPSSYRFVNKDVSWSGAHKTLYTLGSAGDGETTYMDTPFEADSHPNPLVSTSNSNLQKIQTAFKNYGLTVLENQAKDYMTDVLDENRLTELSDFRNQKVITSDGKIYKITYYQFPPFLFNKAFTIPYASNLGIVLGNLYRNSGAFNYYNNNMDYILEIRANEIQIFVERLYDEEYSYSFTDARVKTADVPYDIFAVPMGRVVVKNTLDEVICETSESLAIPMLMSLQKEKQTNCIDIQLLPFCPLNNIVNEDGSITVPSDQFYSPIKKGEEEVVGVILHSPNSSFSFTINKRIELPSSVINKKIINQCRKYRLCSPNYSNYFDFNLARNGTINYFEVDCQYKPYTPYIHIVPQFGELYGGDFNDPRGLVLGGDFSLSQVTDQWKQFEINNKNYQLSFDRQIQSLELQQSVERENQAWGMIAGTLQGGASGAFAGSMTGSPIGIAIGAGVGAISSLAAGSRDYELGEKLRTDALDLARTQHEYNLQNIRALPITLSKISSFNPNNKVFPVLEIYDCLPEEKKAFARKLAFEGMSIGGIGTFEEHLDNDWVYIDGDVEIRSKGFIRGQILQIPTILEDTHLVRAIADELSKGIYTIM